MVTALFINENENTLKIVTNRGDFAVWADGQEDTYIILNDGVPNDDWVLVTEDWKD